jgi:hypothetical protein
MTQEELESLCKKWQSRLRLNDWDIIARLMPLHAFEKAKEGHVDMVLESKQAEIKIMNWEGYCGDHLWPTDLETILVHELLHLHFEPLGVEEDSAADTAQEQAIHAIAGALVKLSRGE